MQLKKKWKLPKKKKNARKTSSGSFALKRYETEVDKNKKEVKALSDEIETFKKEGENHVNQKSEEFQKAIYEEEDKLTQLNKAYSAKISQKQRQIEDMTSIAATLTSSLESVMDELKRSGNTLRSHLEVEFKLDDADKPVFVQLPVYLVKFVKGNEEKFNVFAPIAIAENVGALNGLKQMLSLNPEPKLKVLMHPANKKLQENLGRRTRGESPKRPCLWK